MGVNRIFRLQSHHEVPKGDWYLTTIIKVNLSLFSMFLQFIRSIYSCVTCLIFRKVGSNVTASLNGSLYLMNKQSTRKLANCWASFSPPLSVPWYSINIISSVKLKWLFITTCPPSKKPNHQSEGIDCR